MGRWLDRDRAWGRYEKWDIERVGGWEVNGKTWGTEKCRFDRSANEE